VGADKKLPNMSALARELEIDRTGLYHWQRLAGDGLDGD